MVPEALRITGCEVLLGQPYVVVLALLKATRFHTLRDKVSRMIHLKVKNACWSSLHSEWSEVGTQPLLLPVPSASFSR